MRRALYRTAWLLIVCVLVFALSVPPIGAAPVAADTQPIISAIGSSDTSCTTATDNPNDQFAWRSLLDQVATPGGCPSSPTTVLIAKQRPAQEKVAASVGSDLNDVAQITALR